jgi:hypothetical protein
MVAVHAPEPATGRARTEEEVKAEVERLLALRPAAPAPSRVLVFEVPSSGHTHIRSPRKRLLLRRETAHAMKTALEDTGFFQSVDFLPDLFLEEAAVGGLGALRIAAARAHADGLLLYSTEAGYEYRPNPLALSYLTIVGAFLAPGSRGSALALSRAVLVDVRTGYLYDVMEGYGEQGRVAPVAFLDEEALEHAARVAALNDLAKAAAEKVRRLAAE